MPKTESCNHIENPPKRERYAIPNPTVGSALDELKPDANFLKDKIKIKSSKRGKYLTPCPDIQSVFEKPDRNANLPLLKNGLLGRVRVARKDVFFYNTCSFDSLAQSVLAKLGQLSRLHYSFEE